MVVDVWLWGWVRQEGPQWDEDGMTDCSQVGSSRNNCLLRR